MNRIYAKRALSVALSVFLVLTFTVLTTAHADAASKKKTIYVPISNVSTIQFGDGDVSTSTCKYTYNKKGLLISTKTKQDDSTVKTTWKRNARGTVIGTKTKENGKLTASSKNKLNKKGRVTKATDYSYEKGKKKQRQSVTRYTYFKNGKVKRSVYTSCDKEKATFTTYFRKDGTIRKTVSTSKEGSYRTTYNEKGDEVAVDYTLQYGKGSSSTTYTYDEEGNALSSVQTDKFTNNNGTVSTTIRTTTSSYTYDKHGNITEQIVKTETDEDGEISVSTSTDTFQYKKIKIAKKYLKYVYDL